MKALDGYYHQLFGEIRYGEIAGTNNLSVQQVLSAFVSG